VNVLVIAPHPDDESIGCGGTICLHVERGDRVAVAFLTSGELGLKHLPREEAWRVREGEAGAAAAVLGIAETYFLRLPDWFLGDHLTEAVQALLPVLERERPDSIYVTHPFEWHPDHQAAPACLQAALQQSGGLDPLVLFYEVWTPLAEYEQVEDISKQIGPKLRAIRCYRSQLRGFRYDRAARGLGQYRGALAGHCLYAEVFKYHYPGSQGGSAEGA
jgi:LmbE family N-acetylglucosaminyl deacetylase